MGPHNSKPWKLERVLLKKRLTCRALIGGLYNPALNFSSSHFLGFPSLSLSLPLPPSAQTFPPVGPFPRKIFRNFPIRFPTVPFSREKNSKGSNFSRLTVLFHGVSCFVNLCKNEAEVVSDEERTKRLSWIWWVFVCFIKTWIFFFYVFYVWLARKWEENYCNVDWKTLEKLRVKKKENMEWLKFC